MADRTDADRRNAGERARRPGSRRGRDRDGLRHFRRPYRAHRLGAQQISELDPHGAGARGVAGRGHGRDLRPADAAARRAARARSLGARQRAARHDRGLSVELADAAVDRFQRCTALHVARALPAGDRGLGKLGRAARLQRRHQARHAGARPDRRGAGDPARDQARARRAAGTGRRALQPRLAGRLGCPRFAADALSDAPLPAAGAAAGRAGAGRGRRQGHPLGAKTGADRRQRGAHRAGL